MMPNTATASSGITTTNTSAAFTSSVKAMIIAPNTTKGERSSSRSTKLSPERT